MATEKMNLSPQERRLVVGVGLVVFVVLNLWLVWPHFGDWRKVVEQRSKAEQELATRTKGVEQLPKFQRRLAELENAGPSIVEDERDLNLANLVQTQAQIHKLDIIRNDPSRAGTSGAATNQFFDEKAVTLTYRSDTEALVNFLRSLTDTNSLIRVRDLGIKPEPGSIRLGGTIVLVGSYQRKAPVAHAPAVVTNAAAKAIPASAPSTKTNTALAKPASSTNSTAKPVSQSSTNAPSGIPIPRRQLPTPAK